MRGAPEGCAGADSECIQESYGSGDISSEAEREESVMGRAVLDGSYYVATVGERGEWSVVERYVRNQGKPREELRQFKLF